jgi:hypothetical protein
LQKNKNELLLENIQYKKKTFLQEKIIALEEEHKKENIKLTKQTFLDNFNKQDFSTKVFIVFIILFFVFFLLKMLSQIMKKNEKSTEKKIL